MIAKIYVCMYVHTLELWLLSKLKKKKKKLKSMLTNVNSMYSSVMYITHWKKILLGVLCSLSRLPKSLLDFLVFTTSVLKYILLQSSFFCNLRIFLGSTQFYARNFCVALNLICLFVLGSHFSEVVVCAFGP